ncbi:MAG: hypothetical protein IJU48_06340 [Synergistaceae bacterium]|nr:hypothetical protein [Synergistaceae bacterium]
MPKKKDTQNENTDEESKVTHHLEPNKFYRDAEGHYWENRGEILPGRNFYAPAPDWAGHINFYLFEGPEILIEPQRKPLCKVPELWRGADPVDGGNLILTDDEKNELLRTDPQAEKFLRPYMMGRDFINRISRWCLWLKGVEPADIRKCPRVLERIEKVRKFRLSSKSEATRKAADTPMLFLRPRECTTDYLAIPKVSSSTRKYIPIAWLPSNVIAGDKLFVCENSSLYQFGVLNSIVHMAWVRVVSGKLKIDYSYSNTLDYNAFPWPILHPTPWLKDGNPHLRAIEKTAQAILDARAKYPRSSLADLYDERTMPPELRKAHNENDEAVMSAYGFKRHFQNEKFHEEDIVISLMYMYKELTGCEEVKRDYPNREFWLSFYPEDADDDEEVDYDDDDGKN